MFLVIWGEFGCFKGCLGFGCDDIVDHFLTTYGLVIIGLLEVWAVGWIYEASKLRGYINKVSDIKIGKWWDILIKFVIPICLLVLLVAGLYRDIKIPYEGYPYWAIFAFGWMMLLGVFLVSFLFAHFSKEQRKLG